HHDRAQDDLEIGRLEQLGISREREFMDDETGIVVERVEALQEKREQRADIDHADPQERGQKQQEGQKLGPREEDVGDLVEDAAFPLADRDMAHAASSMVTMADLGQISRTRSPCSKLAASSVGISVWMRSLPHSTLKRVTEPW